jgi:hypothetical protein
MVLNDRATCKDRHAAELILARSTRLHQKAEYIAANLSLAQTNPCSRAADHTLWVLTYALPGLADRRFRYCRMAIGTSAIWDSQRRIIGRVVIAIECCAGIEIRLCY